MHRIDGPGATVDNKFTDGDPIGGVQATMVTDDWLNDVQEELLSVLAAAAITPVKGTQNQVLAAIRALSPGITGSMKNASLSVTAASASATFTASEVVVSTTLDGQSYRLANYSQVINLATTGAGGMDTGTAPASGFVALYAIYNPISGARSLLAVNATAAVQPLVYGGASMPAGYTASALVSVLPTTAASLFAVCVQTDSKIDIVGATALTTSTPAGTTPITLTTTVFPKNARLISGSTTVASTAASGMSVAIYSSDAAVGRQINNGTVTAGGQQTVPFTRSSVRTPQTIRYTSVNSSGTPTFVIEISSYEI